MNKPPPLLEPAEPRLEDLFDGLQEAVLVVGHEGRCIAANAAASSLFGYERAELVGMCRSDLVAEDEAESAAEHQRSLEGGNWQARLRRKDGTVLAVEGRAQRLDLAGGPVQIIILTRPAGEAARDHAEAEAARQQLTNILESTSEGIYGVDREGCCTFINRAAAELLGYTQEEVLGRDLHQLVHHTRSDGTPYPEAECPVNTSALHGNRSRLDDEVLWRKDGTPLAVEYSVSPMVTGGAIEGAVVAFIDITARRQAEADLQVERERLQRLVNANIIGIFRAGVDGGIVEANDAFLELIGHSRAALETGQLRLSAITPAELHILGERAIAEAKERGVCTPYETEYLRTDGLRVPVLVGFALLESNPAEVIGFVVDQSARQRVERALEQLLDRESAVRREAEENERRYQALAETMPQMVWSADRAGNIDYVNQRWYAYTGQRPGAALGNGWQAVLHPDDREACLAHWRSSVRTGKTFELEYRLRGRDGVYRWHLARALPVRDGDGEIQRWFGTCTEIDAQKRGEQGLTFLAEASAVLFSSLDFEVTLQRVAQLAVPRLADWCSIHVLAEDGSIRNVAVAHADPSKVELARELQQRYPPNPAAQAGVPHVLRTGGAELVPDFPDELLIAAAPDDAALAILRELGLKSAMTLPLIAHGKTLGALTLIWAESGHHYSETDRAFAEELANRAALAIDNARLFRETETALQAQAAERERLQQILDVMPEGVVVVDAAGQVLARNAAALDIWGWPDRETAPEANVMEYAHYRAFRVDGTPLPVEEIPLVRSIATGEVVRGEQLVVTRAHGGETVPLLASSAPLRDARGRISGAVTVFQDISSIKELERQKDDFLAAVSHDLKNPLATVKGLAQLLARRARRLDEADASRLQDGLRTIDQTATRAALLLNELLDVTRLHMGRPLELDRTSVDLVELARRAVAEIAATTQRHVFRIDADSAEVWGEWDAARLARVLGNLLGNAVKYSPNGGEIRIGVALDPDGPFAALRVTDQGLGIPAADLPRVFERFYRAGNVSDAIAGSGIGLAAVRQIVERHGGSVSVESEVGRGTTFTVRLPLQPEGEAPADADERLAEREADS
ncbi:MAG TPA: PAS domain S-box protein [Dehalococcoidia bacterium]